VGWFVSLIAASISMVVAGDSDAVDVWVLVVTLVFGPMLGEWQRTRNAYLGELHAAAARSEADRERDVRAAQLAERAHLARELHDVVAHHVSMMVVQAEAGASSAAASTDTDVSGAVAAFDAIAANGRRTLGELRTLLDVLRTDRSDRAPTAPQPGIDAVDALVRQAQATGMSISLSIRGERRPLPPAVDLSAYRAVQEGLTNVVKHGEGAHADVSICFEPGNVRISVVDDGAGGTPTAAPGHGLDGLRERVRLLEGTMTAGPRPTGGFELSVALPAGR
jgi:signal transduction histidine kinase